jgi:hypothetical protein
MTDIRSMKIENSAIALAKYCQSYSDPLAAAQVVMDLTAYSTSAIIPPGQAHTLYGSFTTSSTTNPPPNLPSYQAGVQTVVTTPPQAVGFHQFPPPTGKAVMIDFIDAYGGAHRLCVDAAYVAVLTCISSQMSGFPPESDRFGRCIGDDFTIEEMDRAKRIIDEEP